MLIDARELPDGHVLSADVCIVGAGAAGISMALQFIGTRLNVLLLESGGAKADPVIQDLYSGSVVDPRLHSPPIRYRQRRFGGSTTIWGGRCVPFDEIDFQSRPYVPHSGWPFGRQALEPYYERAGQLCETGRNVFAAGEAFAAKLPPMMPGFSSQTFTCDSLERFSMPTDFGTRYGKQLRHAPNIRTLLHTNLTGLHLNAAGTAVVGATARTLDGKQFDVSGRTFVLATGGLEVARLLLLSDDIQRAGIGNDRDVVGRYYMCHIAGTVGSLKPNRPNSIWNGYDVSEEGVYCRRRLALKAEAQRRLGIGNFVARLHHPRITDPSHRTGILSFLYFAKSFIRYEYGTRLHDEDRITARSWLRHALNILTDLGGTSAFLLHWIRRRILARRKFPSIVVRSKVERYSIDFHAEQQPNRDSRVTLGTDRDALGLRRLHIDWRYTQADVETVRLALGALAADLQGSDVGTLDYDPAQLEAEITRYGAYGGHHIGTARMGVDPSSSVVNADCRVHGVDNLFVAGSAVFPTSSQANPTFTIVALALKLADHLQARLAPGGSGLVLTTSAPEACTVARRTRLASAA